MSLHLSKISLPLIEKFTKQLDLSDYEVLIIQHWVRDAIELWLYLQNNSNAWVTFLPKPYSQDEKSLEYGYEKWLKIINPWKNYEDWLEKDCYIEDILKQFNNKTLLIIEVWWIVAEKIIKENRDFKNIKWIIEITTFWHNRHLQAETNKKIPFFSVARSPIKEEESKYVWEAVYHSLFSVLNELDRPISNCNITMVWYWMIWNNVCNAFKWNVSSINVYDINEEKIEIAKKNGFNSDNNYSIFKDSDIIIASTWFRSIDENFIKSCKDWVLLVSAWSRQNEIDLEYLEDNTEKDIIEIHKFIKRYVINWKEVFLFRNWMNANFAFKSCPASSMDLLHREVLECVKNILDWNYNSDKDFNEISNEKRNELIEEHKKIWI